MIDLDVIARAIRSTYGLDPVACENLNTLANDVIAVTTRTGRFALKLYNPDSRTANGVRWESDLTLHLLEHGVPVARPLPGHDDYVQTFHVNGRERVAVLFDWAPGEKPRPDGSTYGLLGEAAALIHEAADSFSSPFPREKYDFDLLIDEQMARMKEPLIHAGRLEPVEALMRRLRRTLARRRLEWGVCHMDLTLDNVHRNGDALIVFDLDSAAEGWRPLEPAGVLRSSPTYFEAWLEGYRSVRRYTDDDEDAVAAFAIIGDLRNVVWKLGLARSSRGQPLLSVDELPTVVDGWLQWEREMIFGREP